jgi:hypothetical protein
VAVTFHSLTRSDGIYTVTTYETIEEIPAGMLQYMRGKKIYARSLYSVLPVVEVDSEITTSLHLKSNQETRARETTLLAVGRSHFWPTPCAAKWNAKESNARYAFRSNPNPGRIISSHVTRCINLRPDVTPNRSTQIQLDNIQLDRTWIMATPQKQQ